MQISLNSFFSLLCHFKYFLCAFLVGTILDLRRSSKAQIFFFLYFTMQIRYLFCFYVELNNVENKKETNPPLNRFKAELDGIQLQLFS